MTDPTGADAVDREIAWLSGAAADGVPALLHKFGGPWQVISRKERTPNAQRTAIYLWRATQTERRFANHRKIQTHSFRGRLVWPIGATAATPGLWVAEQKKFDLAVEQLLARIRETPWDHTHGGRFLAVAEGTASDQIVVQYADPDQAVAASAFTAEIQYSADDRDFTG